MGGCKFEQERSSLHGRGTSSIQGKLGTQGEPSRAWADTAPNPRSKTRTNVGPATSLALRPLLAVGTRRTRSTRSPRHTQSGTGRGRRRRGLAWAFLGQPQLSPAVLSPLPHVGLKLRVRGFSSPGSEGGGWGRGRLPSAWESGPGKQKLDVVARPTLTP